MVSCIDIVYTVKKHEVISGADSEHHCIFLVRVHAVTVTICSRYHYHLYFMKF